MAAYNKFNIFVENVIKGVHNFTPSTGHTFKTMLTNVAPIATNAVKGDLTEITAANGYSAGGGATTISAASQSSGVLKAVINPDVIFTAAGGTIGPLRYVVFYNDTPSSPLKPLISFWDFGSSVTLNDTETFTVDYDQTNGVFTLA